MTERDRTDDAGPSSSGPLPPYVPPAVVPPAVVPPAVIPCGERVLDDPLFDDRGFDALGLNDRGLDDLGFDDPAFERPPEYDDTMPDPSTLTPYVRRQMMLGRFLDDAEIVDRQLAIAAARRARSVDELREVSVANAAEEEADDATKPPELRANRGQEAGWSIQNRAKSELTTELAMAYTISKNAARTLIEESQTLVGDLPLTLEALGDGLIRYEHAKLIAHTAWALPKEARSAFEQQVLPWAKTLIISAFKTKLLKAREELHSESMQERHERASASRSVTLEPGEDGSGYLTIRDTNEVLAAIFHRVTDVAMTTFAGDPRTLAQRRADVSTELLLKGDLCAAVDEAQAAAADGSAGAGAGAGADTETGGLKRLGHGVVAQVHVEIPVLTLLGLDDAPATLDGRIPIDPVTARRLVADAPGFYRLLTDPITGSVVAFDDKFRYLPKSLRRAVQLVDGTCTAPWCDASAEESDGHHPDEWAESHDTSLANSALLCRPDHRLAHNTRWTMVKLANGDKQWVSPCGRVKRVAPLRRLSPAFVEAMTPDAPVAPDAKQDDWNRPADPGEVMPF